MAISAVGEVEIEVAYLRERQKKAAVMSAAQTECLAGAGLGAALVS